MDKQEYIWCIPDVKCISRLLPQLEANKIKFTYPLADVPSDLIDEIESDYPTYSREEIKKFFVLLVGDAKGSQIRKARRILFNVAATQKLIAQLNSIYENS